MGVRFCGLRQSDWNEALGYTDDTVLRTRMSRWTRGVNSPTPAQMHALNEAGAKLKVKPAVILDQLVRLRADFLAERAGEQWRPVVGFEGYEVSDLGRVGSWLKRRNGPAPTKRHILKPATSEHGYRVCVLMRDGEQVSVKVHQLVLTAFDRPAGDGDVCRHLNGKPADNVISNLQWGTRIENAVDMVRHGRQRNQKLSFDDVREIRRRLADGDTQQAIADYFGVVDTTVSHISTGKAWGWLK